MYVLIFLSSSGPSCWCDLHHPASWEQEGLLWPAGLHHPGPGSPLCGSLLPNLPHRLQTEPVITCYYNYSAKKHKPGWTRTSFHGSSEPRTLIVILVVISKIQLLLSTDYCKICSLDLGPAVENDATLSVPKSVMCEARWSLIYNSGSVQNVGEPSCDTGQHH